MANTSRELLDEIFFTSKPRELTSRSREVYKEVNTKIQKYTSRSNCEDVDGLKVSLRPALEQEAVASHPVALTSSQEPLDQVSRQEVKGESGIVIATRELTSRYSGISVQHVNTAKGIKIAVTLQRPDEAPYGDVLLLTAELKRYDRLREIKSRIDDDTQHFAEYLSNVKSQLQQAKNKNVAMGRLHQRGKRAAWLEDSLVVAFFDNKRIARVMLYLATEEVVIELDQPLSQNQQKYYLGLGYQGVVKKGRDVPTFDSLPRTKFGGY